MPLKVKDVMTNSPSTCQRHDTAESAARIMWEHDCGVVPVVGDDGHLAGVVTDRDLCMAAYLQGARLADISIESVMSHDPAACRPEDELVWAEHLMAKRQVHRLPVVDDQSKVLGVLSMSDVATAARKSADGHRKGDIGEELLKTVAEISKPRTRAARAS